MKTITINKKLNFTENSIEIRYVGTPLKDNINTPKIQALLDNFITTHKHTNMIENVTIIRTILKDYQEQLLVISSQDKTSSELACYNNSHLFLYEKLYEKTKKTENSANSNDKYKITYAPESGIRLTYNHSEFEVTDYSSVNHISKELTKILKQVHSLASAKAIILTQKDKALIELYKHFYNETPDFSSKDINLKVQAMLIILAEFGISLGDYSFSQLKKTAIPISLEVTQIVNKLYPLGEATDVEETINLASEPKKITKIVGECIRESIPQDSDLNTILITISKTIHASRYSLTSNSDIQKLSKFTDQTPDQVASNIKLVKRIKKQIANQIN